MEPTTEPSASEPTLIDIEKLTPLVKPGLTGHKWVQRGNSLICEACHLPHGMYLPPHLLLAGFTKDGTPKLVHFSKYKEERAKLMSEQNDA